MQLIKDAAIHASLWVFEKAIIVAWVVFLFWILPGGDPDPDIALIDATTNDLAKSLVAPVMVCIFIAAILFAPASIDKK